MRLAVITIVALMVLGFRVAVATPAVYTWQQNGTSDWQSASSWMPPRIAPASDDVLRFELGGTIIATNVPTQTIGQLIVSRTTSVDLQADLPATLTIAGGVNADLLVESSSALNLAGENAIAVDLAAGTTGIIAGAITFSSTGSADHRMTAADNAATTFEQGATFTAGNGLLGNPFGTTNLNSIVFAGGSTYVCMAGGDPFGAPEPSSVVVFEERSLFSLRGNVGSSFFSGRRYANFELNSPGQEVWVTGAHSFVVNDLAVTAGSLYLNLSGDPGHSIRGNITTASGTNLTFSSGTVRLNGVAEQRISGLGIQGAGGASTIVIDNPQGLALDRPLVAWNLVLANGKVNTGPFDYLGVAGNLSRVNGCVNGYLRRILFGVGSYAYHLGTENGYSPAFANVTAGTFPAVLQFGAFQTAEPNISNPSKALTRYWQGYKQGLLTADITFQYMDDDIPMMANESDFVIQRYNGGFTQPTGIIDTQANTFRINNLTDFAQDWTLAEPSALLPRGTLYDFDGDGRADVSVFRPGDGAWYLLESTNGFTGVSFGNSTDKIAPADFDGDGKTDVGVYRPSQGTWYWLNSSNGTLSAVPFGSSEDLPTPADYDGDGRADVSVFRPSNGAWYRLNSHDGSFYAVQFGASEDKPTLGDYDGDGRADVAVWRPSNGAWYRLDSSNGQFIGISFGLSTDLITPADFDGDGKTDVAVYRASTGTWYSLDSSNGALRATPFGTSEDVPTAADFDGDGRADVSVFRPSNGVWYRLNSGNGSFFAVQFGISTDRPTPAAFRY